MWYVLVRDGKSSQGGVNMPTQVAACYGTTVNAPIQGHAKTRRYASDRCRLAMDSGLVGVPLPYHSSWPRRADAGEATEGLGAWRQPW